MTDIHIVPTQDLLGATQYLDRCVDLLRQVQAAGVEVTAEQLTLVILSDTDRHRESRTTLVLAVALQRLASQQ